MNAQSAPFWYGQPRGTEFGPEGIDFTEDDDNLPPLSFLDQLRKQLFGWPTDTFAGVIAWWTIFATSLAAAGLLWTVNPWFSVAALLAGLAWTTLCIRAALLARSETAPAWARGLVDYLVGSGRALVVAVEVATIVAIVVFLFAAIGAARGSRYS